MIYLDSSALLKLLFEEPESPGLADWLTRQSGTPTVSSELASIEVVRATRRLDVTVVPTARRLVSQLDLVPMTSDLVSAATDVGDDLLRSLDAIHLATALSLAPGLTAVVAYDARLARAAVKAGLEVAQPGV